MTKYFLKGSIKAEPLIWSWYAWPHLIPPTNASCNIVERHLKIMESYVQNPQVHAQAIKNPAMLGGPFIDLDGKYINEIKELIRITKEQCAELIKLHSAIKLSYKMLQNEAQGGSIESLYAKLPEDLKGFVELVYDLDNHPSVRFIEPFLYAKYYDDRYQSIVLSNIKEDFRKFILGTPRLDENEEIYLKLPFADKRLDDLFKLKYEPLKLKEILSLFTIPQNKLELFKSFFISEEPKQKNDNNYQGEGLRVRYFGHACVLIQTKYTSILLDPVISYSNTGGIPRYTFDDLPSYIDYVLITHCHHDHLMFETLLQIRHKIGHIIFPANVKGFLADPSIKLILQHTGFSSLIELGEMETVNFKDGYITGLPFFGEHADLNIQSKLSYYVNIHSKTFMFAADSNNLDEYLYDNIFSAIGTVDTLFVGMECKGAPLTWLYGPLITGTLTRQHDNSRRLSGSNSAKAWSIVNKLRCKQAYVYAMGKEPWLNYAMALDYSTNSIQIVESDKFVEKCQTNGILSERLFGQKEWMIQ